MNDVTELLRRYRDSGAQDAFATFVACYVDLVYSAALRRVGGDAHLAKDVTQMVFCHLARQVNKLDLDRPLGGWLHKHTGFIAGNLMKSELRRRRREEKAAAMQLNDTHSDPNSLWSEVSPVLEDAMDRLSSEDRDALVLRFFEKRDLRGVGVAMGLNEEAARKRISRALDKLRAHLARRGVRSSAEILSSLLHTHAVALAPAGLAAGVAAWALAGAGSAAAAVATASGAGTTLAAKKSALLLAGFTSVVFVGSLTGNYFQQQEEARLAAMAAHSPKVALAAEAGQGSEPSVAKAVSVEAAPEDPAQRMRRAIIRTGAAIERFRSEKKDFTALLPILERLEGTLGDLMMQAVSTQAGTEYLEAVETKLRHREGEMQNRLALTPEQVAQIKPVMDDYARRMGEIWKRSLIPAGGVAPDLEDGQRKQMAADLAGFFRNEKLGYFPAELSAMLTDEQRQWLATWQGESRKKLLQLVPDEELIEVQRAVSLTSEQKDLLYQKFSDAVGKDFDLHCRQGPAPGQPGGAPTRQEVLKSVLTPEQQQRMQEDAPDAWLREAWGQADTNHSLSVKSQL